VHGHDRERWLALMADDVVIEDPIGPAVTNPDNGVRGKEAVAACYDNNNGQPADRHLRGDISVQLTEEDRPHPFAAQQV
jgi:hypothetical protein